MKKKYQLSKIIILLLLIFITTSCETISDCIDRIRPELISKELRTGVYDVPYEDNVNFEMIRGNTNDYYISSISIEGKLPPGFNYSVVNNNTINFKGTPIRDGTYEFTISISVSPHTYNEDGTGDLCGNTTSKKYTIKIIDYR
ncbi:hypothetical protein ACFSJW_06985 [Flavobacterium artemisiae]|uniref:Lipoprotein n=1 Tax=Flavobacterium artemisiae TaxID=2126556 RepID=A0ABW4HBZ8_9FLAO